MLNEEYIPEANNHIDKININAELRSLRIKNLNKLIIRHLNINSLNKKFELLTHKIKVSGTKLDESFLASHFFMNDFSSPHCLDRNCNGGGVLLYIREDIPSKLLSIEGYLTEPFFVKINLYSKKKCLICCSYNPKRASIVNHIPAVSKSTDTYISPFHLATAQSL